MVRDVRGLEWSFIWFQKLGLGDEIHRVVLDNAEADRGLYVLLVCLICCIVGVMFWAVPRWNVGLSLAHVI